MKFTVSLFTLLFFFSFNGQSQELKSFGDSLSYAMGLSLENGFKNQRISDIVDPEIIAKAIQDSRANANSWNTESSEAWIQTAMQRVMEMQSEKTKLEGLSFLEENGKRKEVTTTASGLQYEVILEGTGVSPLPENKVTVHYTGTLIDGSKFDSSLDRGQPATFGLTQVIKGWTEGLQLMKEGAKYKFYIPYDLGYGCGSAPGGAIPPCSTLVFEVELISVQADAPPTK